MGMGDYKESCSRCGAGLYDLRGMRADVDGSYYCASCAEELGKHHLAENVCFSCNKAMRSSDVKFVLPSKVLASRPLPMRERLMCGGCYRRFAVRSKSRVRNLAAARARAGLRAISGRFLTKSLQL